MPSIYGTLNLIPSNTTNRKEEGKEGREVGKKGEEMRGM